MSAKSLRRAFRLSLPVSSPGTNSTQTLTLYGKPGVKYDLLSATNLAEMDSWNIVKSLTLTGLFEDIKLGAATNRMQFFKAVQP
jgi:hypothetical protein